MSPDVLGSSHRNPIPIQKIGHSLTQELRNVYGVEFTAYTDMMAESYDEAFSRMVLDIMADNQSETAGCANDSARLLVDGTSVRLEDG